MVRPSIPPPTPLQVGHYGNQPGANQFCVFDGHGSHGKDAATYSRQVLPALLDGELRKFFAVRSSLRRGAEGGS